MDIIAYLIHLQQSGDDELGEMLIDFLEALDDEDIIPLLAVVQLQDREIIDEMDSL